MIGYFDDPMEEELRQRDRMQFELGSVYSPPDTTKRMKYTHEFYFFIPSALQINRETYTRNQFYLDQTNLIRFRTPRLSLHELADSRSSLSPLGRMYEWIQTNKPIPSKEAKFELKLYGNMVRSQIRDRVYRILHMLRRNHLEQLENSIRILTQEIETLHMTFTTFQSHFNQTKKQKILDKFCGYVDEFICTTSENYLVLLLKEIRKHSPLFSQVDDEISELLIAFHHYRDKKGYQSPYAEIKEKRKEYLLYRAGLLNKFVLEALLLSTERKEPAKRFDQLIATIAAGTAMFLYIFLLVWYGHTYFVDATAFIIASVVLYILKDRMKEGLKLAYYTLAFRFFPDYSTKISTNEKKHTLGELRESFTYLSRSQLPKEILKLRDQTFHSELELARRMENIFHFKKDVILYPGYTSGVTGLKDLHDIFRFNISQFTMKASDVYQKALELDPLTREIRESECPKVYHINVIIKKTFTSKESDPLVEISKVRIVLNKEGIERIEQLQ